jgi:hypothetical protein
MALAGLTFVGSGISMFYQIILTSTRVPVTEEAIVTVLLAILPILVGMDQIRNALRSKGKADRGTRMGSAALGLVGFLVWAGILVGPLLAIIASVLPQNKSTNGNNGNR